MPRYVFILQMIDESARLDGDALATAIARLGPLGKRDEGSWVGECDAESEGDARRYVESRLARLPRYVPKFELVELAEA